MSIIRAIVAGCCLVALCACEKREAPVRFYKEIRFAKPGSAPAAAPAEAPPAIPPAAGQMGDLPPEMRPPALPLEWVTPEGWENLGSSGVRIATLKVQGVECSITSFPGDVGGDEANIRRWLGQLSVQVSEDKIKSFASAPVKLQTSNGVEIRMFDYADLIGAGATTSTLVSIIPMGEQLVFVKMTGDAAVLAAQKSAFENLCRSVRMAPQQN